MIDYLLNFVSREDAAAFSQGLDCDRTGSGDQVLFLEKHGTIEFPATARTLIVWTSGTGE